MNRTRYGLALLPILAAMLLLAGCGHKRPPAIATAPPGSAQGGGAGTPLDRSGAEPVEAGPDIRQIENEGLGEDALSDASGEGGPLEDVRFEYDQATLTDQARALLEKHALWLQNQRSVRVTLEGHCDERGTVEYNLALGDQRAQAVRSYLVSLGVSADRLKAVSYGKERPLDPGHDEAAWARNRRVHLFVSR